VRYAAEYGWRLEPGAIDMAVVRKRKRDMVAAQVAKHLENYKASGAELIMGSGRFVAPTTIEVLLAHR
jgi:pyruvate/2-oxoglutarate dehydrogenase complex dihydrolipoamide dehydrogenase (E3) component